MTESPHVDTRRTHAMGDGPESPATTTRQTRYLGRTRSGALVATICCSIVVFDGYDVSVYGATLPELSKYPSWQASASVLGLIGSLTMVGMLVGSLVCGFATDRLGRKRMLVTSTTWFSLCMIVCACAPNLTVFAMFRLLAGIGLGGVLPTVNAFAIEFAPAGRRNFFAALVNIGFALGTLLSALLSIAVLDRYGFRPMYALAALPLLVVPIVWFVLPESADYLAAKGRRSQASQVADHFQLNRPIEKDDGPRGPSRLRSLLGPALLPKILLFGLCGVCVQLVIYGLNTWLPQLMEQSGYPSTSALTLHATLSIGAVAGSLTMGVLADRIGVRTMTIVAFGIGALALAILSSGPPTVMVFVAVALAGVGSNGTAIMLYGYVGTWFPSTLRASALGTFISVARLGGILAPLVGGWIIAVGWPTQTNFVALLIPAALGALLGFALPRLGQTQHTNSKYPHPDTTPHISAGAGGDHQ